MLIRFLLVVSLFFIMSNSFANGPIKYVALGDSYTIGTGAQPPESWPSVVTDRLQKKGIPIELVANVARNGWTTKDVIDYELPYAIKSKPNVVSILIGTNDWVQGFSVEIYRKNIQIIFDELVKLVGSSNVIVITSPDFSISPAGSGYSSGRNIPQGLSEFNNVLHEEAKLRNLKVIDIYPLSQTMGKDSSFFSDDGLHPSAKGYALWADLIEPSFLPK